MAQDNKNQKRERFERLATYRTNEVLRKLQILGHCANRSAYDYSEEEINKIFAAVEKQVKETRAKFHFGSKRRKFSLK